MLSARIRRNRERLACLGCRRRKLRCDHNAPCSSCVRRGDAPSCSYEAAAGNLDPERDLSVQAEERLAHLEQLVHQLAAQNKSTAAERSATSALTASATNRNGANPGQDASTVPPVQGEPENQAYIGASHWPAMLEDIQALRSAVSSGHGDDLDSESMSSGQAAAPIALLFGIQTSSAISIKDILKTYLPSRHEADCLVSSYFWRTSVAAPFVHAQQFRRQYQAFWASPSTTPVLWTSTLFSILHVAIDTLTTAGKPLGAINQYSVAAAHCLILGEYIRPRRFAVEALLLYLQSCCLTSLELSPDIGPAFSVLTRLATAMGYHRDPNPLIFSPFEKEMRRRTWSMSMQLDLLTSFHLGLPSSVQYPTWDTLPPSSLLDSEFDEDTVTLPTPLPRTELTGMPFYVAKHHLMVVFEKILQHVLTVRSNMDIDNEIVALDGEVRRVQATLPRVLQRKPLSKCTLESPSVIVTRLCVSLLYNKCLCVLHRLYVTKGREDSIRECYTAASAIVEDFVDAEKECRPGGVLEGEQWYMTSITWHDFLLGATSLCMVVCATSQGLESPCTDMPAMLALLEKARLACHERTSRINKGTARVVAVINATIRQFGAQDGEQEVGVLSEPDEQGHPGTARVDSTAVGLALPWIDNMAGTFDDPNWSFLDRFLDLPSQDF